MANGNWPTDPNASVFAGCNCGAFAVTASAIGMPTTHAPTCPQCTPTDRYWHDQLAAERALRVAAEAERNSLGLTLRAAVSRLGGIVDGNTTGMHNLLQRIDELRKIEANLNRYNGHAIRIVADEADKCVAAEQRAEAAEQRVAELEAADLGRQGGSNVR